MTLQQPHFLALLHVADLKAQPAHAALPSLRFASRCRSASTGTTPIGSPLIRPSRSCRHTKQEGLRRPPHYPRTDATRLDLGRKSVVDGHLEVSKELPLQTLPPQPGWPAQFRRRVGSPKRPLKGFHIGLRAYPTLA